MAIAEKRLAMENSNEYQDSRYFRTSSFYTACFLFAKEQVLVNIDKVTDPKRAHFVFLDSPERELLLQEFNYAKENAPGVLIDTRKFITSIKQLKDKLYQQEF